MKIKNILANIVAPLIAAIAAASGLSWWLSRRGGKIEPLLNGEDRVWKWRDQDISFTCAGEGKPVVLIHSLFAGASSTQWESNFSALTRQFRVFAPDMLGFGRSSRPSLDYTPELYKDLIVDFLKENVDGPAMVVVAGQSAPYVIEAAAENPDLISRLILDSPTGLARFSEPASWGQKLSYLWWSLPVIGTLAYMSMVSKRQIAQELRSETVEDPSVITPSSINNIYREAHQPGAKWAPIALLSGRLNCDVSLPYGKINQPILVLWGEMPSRIPISDSSDFLSRNKNAVLQTFPDAKLMPEFEHSSKFNAYVQMWAEGKIAA